MLFENFEEERQFRDLWESVRIERPVHYSLFTFGESVLPYFLVLEARTQGGTVSVRKGEVRVARPTIITPDSFQPDFENFFDADSEGEGIIDFLLARTAAFSHLKISNKTGSERIVTDSMEEAVDKLNQQLDDEEEEHVAILSAPARMSSVAVLKYATQRIVSSAPDNVTELRERGFLP